MVAVNVQYCRGTCWGELQQSTDRFANWVGPVYKAAVERIEASFSVNKDKKTLNFVEW